MVPPTEPPVTGDNPGDDGPSLTRFVWRHVLIATHSEANGDGWTCPARTVDDPPGLYYLYQWVLVDLTTGLQVEARDQTCHWNPPPPTTPPPEPPPVPPTTGEIVEEMKPLLQAEPHWNPKVTGLTGLETFLWCTDPGEVVVPITIDGWEIVGHAGITDVDWEITGPETVSLDGRSCGSEEDPSVRWMPNIKGSASVQTVGTWGGYWTLSRWGELLGTYDLGTVEVPGTPMPYEILEHVGVLIN